METMRVVPCFVILCFLQVFAEEEIDDDSYSYQKFRGPVSGHVQEIQVDGYHDNQHYPTVDYFAKPDYLYTYGVQDPRAGLSQLHKETRNDDAVIGEYKVLQPDGFLRIVKYTADGEHGFRASVQYVKV